MTSQEMSLEFDILYNNIASNMAPGIDAYEKSVFLTKAQEQIVTAIYDGSFEGSEKLRECISPLVKTVTFTTPLTDNIPIGVSSDSKFYKIDEDEHLWYIVYESISLTDETCDSKKQVAVKPVKIDEYHRIRKNPFRKARKHEALRLNTEGFIEIVYPSSYGNFEYSVRFIRRPNPILVGADYECPTIEGYNLSEQDPITGIWTPVNMDCELLDAIHRTIVETAVNLAIAAYKSTNN